MRELHFLEEESTETFFVLRDNDGVRYQLAREELLLHDAPVEPSEDAAAELDAANPAEAVEPEAAPAPAEPASTPAAEERSLPEPDPLYATPLSMRPNEIQARIRAGASPAELAEEMGVAESRLDTYAHPVLLERSQVAEAAKGSHPVREDGPAKLTLFEILATAFAARGHSIADAIWDATREQGDDWVVHVRWQAGLSENEALWSFKRSMTSPPQTEARNASAADLTDPDFAQPVRSLTAVNASRGEDAFVPEDDYDEYDALEAAEREREEADTQEGSTVVEGDFLRHPDEEEQPQQRRRKAVTPHWEDVLLGVRTNTKRPKR